MPRTKPAEGRYGRLVVIEVAGADPRTSAVLYRCQCDCGVKCVVNGQYLRRGATRSCGCLQREHRATAGRLTRTHGRRKTPEYYVWQAMIQRCENQSHPAFERYGGRGIRVCDRWRHDFAAFLADVGPRPSPDLTLDRIDSNGNYEPSNVRWATWTEQERNRCNVRRLTLDGLTLTMPEWAERTGIGRTTIKERLKRGWTVERALTVPA